MGQFDELLKMGEMVDAIGDNPPTKEAIEAASSNSEEPAAEETPGGADAEGQAAEVISPQVISEDAGFSGGSAGFGVETDGFEDLDEILGIEIPKGPARETPAEPGPEQAPDQEGVQQEEPERQEARTERVDEWRDRVKFLEEQNRMILAKLTDSRAGAAAEGEHGAAGGDAGEGVEILPEVLEYMAPYVDKLVAARSGAEMKEIRETIAPLKAQAEDIKMANEIGKYVDGFKPSDMGALRAEYEKAPEELQALYGNGIAGAVILAEKTHGRGAPGFGKSKPKSSPLARRHRSETSGQPLETRSNDNKERMSRLLGLNDEQVLQILDSMET